MKTSTELSNLEKEYNNKRRKIEIANKYAAETGFTPSYISDIFGKTLLSFKVTTLTEAEQIKTHFKSDLIPAIIRTAGNAITTISPYYLELKTWSFNSQKEAVIHFETDKEYVDIKVPFECYNNADKTAHSHNYEGDQAELRRYRRQEQTFNSYGLSDFDNMAFYGGSTKTYIKDDESKLDQFEKILFTGIK